jgi:hypothetical protein
MNWLSKHFRSNLVGYVALFFALGLGSAWAVTDIGKNDVTSALIKNKGVKKIDLAKNSVNSAKVAPGTLNADDINPGALVNLSGYEIVLADHDYNDGWAKSATARCPAGKRVLGGGGHINTVVGGSGNHNGQPANVLLSDVLVSESLVFVVAREIRPGIPDDWGLQARAICAKL